MELQAAAEHVCPCEFTVSERSAQLLNEGFDQIHESFNHKKQDQPTHRVPFDPPVDLLTPFPFKIPHFLSPYEIIVYIFMSEKNVKSEFKV